MKARIAAGAAVALALIGAGATSVAAAGGFAANAGVTNNYIWRGLTQTENGAAVQGGID